MGDFIFTGDKLVVSGSASGPCQETVPSYCGGGLSIVILFLFGGGGIMPRAMSIFGASGLEIAISEPEGATGGGLLRFVTFGTSDEHFN